MKWLRSETFRELFSLAWPVIGLNLLSVVTLVVDTAMCGRLDGREEVLTALSHATQLLFLIFVAMIGLSVGVSAQVSRAFGAGEHEEVIDYVRQSIVLTMLLSLLVAVVGNLLIIPYLKLMGASVAVQEVGSAYLRPLISLTIFYNLNVLFSSIFRSVNNSRFPFRVALLSNILNIALNWILMFGKFGMPQMGVSGAAWGTVLSNIVAVVIIFLSIGRGELSGTNVRLFPRTLDFSFAKRAIRVGFPAALDLLVLNVAFLSILRMLSSIAEAAVAAHGIGLRVQALAFVPGLSISQATGALVGNALGAEDPKRAREIVSTAIRFCVLVMTVLALPVIFGADQILRIFDIPIEGELADYCRTWIWILGLGMPILGVNIVYVGMLRGAGATHISLFINIIGVIVQVPFSFILGFPFQLGALGIWAAFPASFTIKAVIGRVIFSREIWVKTGKEFD